jgi:hypothetical protein
MGLRSITSTAAILLFEAEYLEEKLLVDKVFQSHESYLEAFLEFKRYAYLVSKGVGSLNMISPVVDKIWHQFILFTREYTEFCEYYVGDFIHHRPNTSHTPTSKLGRTRFIHEYEKEFGVLPDIWLLKPEVESCSACNCN